MASRDFYVWRIAGDSLAGDHANIGNYSPEVYRAHANRMLILTRDDLDNLDSPEGVRVLLLHDMVGRDFVWEDEFEEIQKNVFEGIRNYFRVGQFSGDQAIVISFVSDSGLDQ